MPARLHHELIGDPAAAAWVVMAHGIYGSGANWRSIARKIVERAPAWGAVLVDLRGHGKSEDGAPPHDLPACAGDVLAVADQLLIGDKAIGALCGHSFGGKVMAQARAMWNARIPVMRTILLDSSPSARPDLLDDPDTSVWKVLDRLEQLPPRWDTRDDFIAAAEPLVGGPAIAGWLAMSLVADGDGFRLRLVPAQLRHMLHDYYRRDLWPAIADRSLPGDVHLIVASRSDSVTAADRERAAALDHCTVDVVDAGHWLHVDAPDATVDAIARRLSPPRTRS
jgi:pimeloyl-ACP methyl ester carboxylesterase